MNEFLREQPYLDEHELAEREAFRQKAEAEPHTDYFAEYRPREPKREVGEYVASQGISVPLIKNQTQWEGAFYYGEAMIRSELPQDYDGLSGVLPSATFTKNDQERIRDGYDRYMDDTSPVFKRLLGSLILTGLRSGDIPAHTYIQQLEQAQGEYSSLFTAARFGKPVETYRGHDIGGSYWRYIPGVNIKLFRDPHVEGRYHLGAHDGSDSGDQIDLDSAPETIRPRKCRHDLPIRQLVDFYEKVRTLPLFDQRQAPLIEMQLDEQGELHFLQYLKTGKMIDPVEPFDLPQGPGIVELDQARGYTDPAGRSYKLYFDPPERADARLVGHGLFTGLGSHATFANQLLVAQAGLVLNPHYLLLKGNHFDTSPLYRPELAIGGVIEHEALKKFEDLSMSVWHNRHKGLLQYLAIHVTANGREAALTTDWQLREEPAL